MFKTLNNIPLKRDAEIKIVYQVSLQITILATGFIYTDSENLI